MRVVFMGTPAFAVPSLESVAREHEVALVVTRPDRAAGRGPSARPSAVREAAGRLGCAVAQPTTLSGEVTHQIAAIAPDVICVAAFGMLLPADLLAVPPGGCVNVHASLLPRLRGAAPIQRCILDGDPETGVSIMRMEAGLDTGPYALQRTIPVGDCYASELGEELARLGAEALVAVLELIADGTVAWTPQDEARATYATKITKDDVALLPALSSSDALRRVRAATRSAPARACVGETELTVVRASLTSETLPAGATCVVDGRLVLGFADGSLELQVVRPSGKGDMRGEDWVRGARLSDDVCWRCTR